MIKVLSLLINKINFEPTVDDMKEFGIKYSKKEWEILTNNKYFVAVFTKNLNIAKKIADNLIINK